MKTTHVLDHAQADITYDVRGPLPTEDGRPPLMMIGQPMDASGFRALAEQFRTAPSSPTTRAGWAARLVTTVASMRRPRSGRGRARRDRALGAGPVDLFASSGGAVTALALVAAHPEDVATLVAHEPPLPELLPDAEAAKRAAAAVQEAYERRAGARGWRRSWP